MCIRSHKTKWYSRLSDLRCLHEPNRIPIKPLFGLSIHLVPHSQRAPPTRAPTLPLSNLHTYKRSPKYVKYPYYTRKYALYRHFAQSTICAGAHRIQYNTNYCTNSYAAARPDKFFMIVILIKYVDVVGI